MTRVGHIVPPVHCSISPLFHQPIVPPVYCSTSPLFHQDIVPPVHCSTSPSVDDGNWWKGGLSLLSSLLSRFSVIHSLILSLYVSHTYITHICDRTRWGDIYGMGVEPVVLFFSKKCSKWSETCRNAITKIMPEVICIAYMSLWQVSPVGHQNKCTYTYNGPFSAPRLVYAASQNWIVSQG